MAIIKTREVGVTAKGTTLSNAEIDNNFINLNEDIATRVPSSEKGTANGVATLDGAGKVPATQLPSYVDDVLEYANLASLPNPGETGKIYVALDTNKTYRWGGSSYTAIASGSVDSVANKTGVVTLNSADVGLANVDNTSDANKPVSTATQTALNTKQAALGYTPVNKAGDTITGDLLNSAAYSAPNNASGAGTKLVIRGSTGTGAAGDAGGNGYIEILGGGATTPWTGGFIGALARARRGGVVVQAGIAQGDADNTYVNGSALEMYAGNGTNNGTTAGWGGRVVLQAGQTTRTDGSISSGGGVTFNEGRPTQSGSFSMSGGALSFGNNFESSQAGGINTYPGTLTEGGETNITAGGYSTGSAQSYTTNSGGLIRLSGATATTGGDITFYPGTVYEGIVGRVNGTVKINNSIVLHAGNYSSYAQPLLVSGTTIKTINGTSVLGSGNIVISADSSDKLPLTGGSLTGDVSLPLNTLTSYAVQTEQVNTFGLSISNSVYLGSAWELYYNSATENLELYHYNYTTAAQNLRINGNVALHAGNYSEYAQPLLVSGTNIKTINGTSVLGSGDIEISGGLTSFNTRTGDVTLGSGDVTDALGFTPLSNATSYLPLTGGSLTGAIIIGGSVAAPADSTATALSYGRLQGYGHIHINADTDQSTSEFVYITAGYATASSSSANGLAVGNTTLTWKDNAVLHAGNYGSYALPLSGGTTSSFTMGVRVASSSYGGNTTGMSGHSFPAEIRANAAKPTLTWHYENVATRHIALDADGALNVYNPGESGGAVFKVGGNTALHAGNYTDYAATANHDHLSIQYFDAPGSAGSYVWVRASMGGFNSGGETVRFSVARSINDNNNSPYGGPSADFTVHSREWHNGQESATCYYTEHGAGSGAGGLYISHAGPRDLAGGGYWFYMRLEGGIRYIIRKYNNTGGIGSFNTTAESDPGSVTAMNYGFNLLGNSSEFWASGGNKVLHAGNYGSYALPLSGGTLSGALTINANEGVSAIYDGSDGQTWLRGWGIESNRANVYYRPTTNNSQTLRIGYGEGANNWGLVQIDASSFTRSGNAIIDSSNYSSYALPLSGGTLSGSIVNNQDGGVIIESNSSEYNNWLWKESAKQWGLFWFNRNTQSGQTIGTYSTIGAELFFMGGAENGISMPTGWTGYQSGSYITAMISNYTGYIYSASTVYAAGSMLVGGNTVLHAGNYTSYSPSLTGGGASGTWGISISGNAATASTVNNTYESGTGGNLLYATVGSDDFVRIRAGSDSYNTGWLEIATADDGNEPIYVRQYTGVFASVTRTLTLLDASGNTTFPGNVQMNGSSQVLHAGNYSSYALPLIGGTINGNVTINGVLSATSKSFLIPHPTKPGMKLRYGSLEGPENGVYIRGKLRGNNKIQLPDYWTKLVEADSITVTLTPVSKHQKLYVEDISDNTVTVGNDELFADEINCFFVVYGERVDIDKLVVESE
jgi:hypothetical protein